MHSKGAGRLSAFLVLSASVQNARIYDLSEDSSEPSLIYAIRQTTTRGASDPQLRKFKQARQGFSSWGCIKQYIEPKSAVKLTLCLSFDEFFATRNTGTEGGGYNGVCNAVNAQRIDEVSSERLSGVFSSKISHRNST